MRRRLVKATASDLEYYKKVGGTVFRPFGGQIYSYPTVFAGSTVSSFGASLIGWVGTGLLVIGCLAYSWVDTLVILVAAILDVEWELLPYNTAGKNGISGVAGWLAGHQLAQLLYPSRSWWSSMGVLTLLKYTRSWQLGEEVSHAAHFQTMGAGFVAAMGLRAVAKPRPIRWLAKNSVKLPLVLTVAYAVWAVWVVPKYYPVVEAQLKPPTVP